MLRTTDDFATESVLTLCVKIAETTTSPFIKVEGEEVEHDNFITGQPGSDAGPLGCGG